MSAIKDSEIYIPPLSLIQYEREHKEFIKCFYNYSILAEEDEKGIYKLTLKCVDLDHDVSSSMDLDLEETIKLLNENRLLSPNFKKNQITLANIACRSELVEAQPMVKQECPPLVCSKYLVAYELINSRGYLTIDNRPFAVYHFTELDHPIKICQHIDIYKNLNIDGPLLKLDFTSDNLDNVKSNIKTLLPTSIPRSDVKLVCFTDSGLIWELQGRYYNGYLEISSMDLLSKHPLAAIFFDKKKYISDLVNVTFDVNPIQNKTTNNVINIFNKIKNAKGR